MIGLSISLFSSKQNWHHILSNAIAPFDEDCPLLNGCLVEFNYLSGDNIRLMLLTEDDNAAQLAKQANEHFRAYFANANLSTPQVELPVEGIFMPFSANSIQYGLYPPQNIGVDELEQYAISVELSKIIIAALKDEIDDEAIITFAFYLKVALIKAIYNITGDIEILLSGIRLANDASKYQTDHNVRSNIGLMKEIADDILHTDKFDGELGWLNIWINRCESLITKSKDATNGRAFITNFYYTQVDSLYRHLSINTHGRNVLNYFIVTSLFFDLPLRKN